MKTILLNPETYDLCLDSDGNIALASEPYALAQDVVSECRTMQGECYYDTSKGIPYFQDILGQFPPLSLMQQYWVDAALLVPDVVEATAQIISFENRKLTAQILFTDLTGQQQGVIL